MSDLFTSAGEDVARERAPLAVRMRPRTLDEVVGQAALVGPGTPLRRLAEGGRAPSSLILWGPPGTGKTTLATLVAHAGERHFVELSAVMAGVKEVRAVVEDARRRLGSTGQETVLFVDEVHRFSRTQQDALLPSVENRWVVLVAATTENPSFSVVSPLLSRSLLLTLQPLDDEDVRTLVRRALAEERGLGGRVVLEPEAEEQLLRIAGGDARRALTSLEAAAAAVPEGGTVDAATLSRAVDRALVRYDKTGDQHYDVASAFIKSMRGSDVDAALHYLARMIEAGEDPRFIARRVVVHAAEDVGMADPTVLQTAVAAAQAVQLIGLPEARIPLAQAVIAVATAPKSNAVVRGIDGALADVRRGLAGPVPAHLRDAHYAGAKRLEHGVGYRYAHDSPHGVVEQQYPPDALVGRDYYLPGDNGAERSLAERVQRLRRVVRGTPGDASSAGDEGSSG
ncbi:recombination protein MgsA [Motilibacter rhizosphaerae]|uniref:Recombination protein MgsA n=1 Tax=Motilibacter rhizosphaerae TaxID=598652 RepID=A0A4Q7NQU9_9ACTN|nr:replication-associated recombination protein A [Motilibacter rhizosphaerae]RZS89427.1 recombination protein MgsA [Motilibacter rhizosphaerae]